MADQSHNRSGFYPANLEGSRLTYYPVAAAQTLAKGDAVILSSGQVAIGLAASANLLGVIAQPAASLTAGTPVAVWDDPDQVFVGAADADSSSSTAGEEVDLVGATGAMLIDVGASVTDVFKLMHVIDTEEDTATARARWAFKINKHLLAQID